MEMSGHLMVADLYLTWQGEGNKVNLTAKEMLGGNSHTWRDLTHVQIGAILGLAVAGDDHAGGSALYEVAERGVTGASPHPVASEPGEVKWPKLLDFTWPFVLSCHKEQV